MKQKFFEQLKLKLKLWLARRLPNCRTITPKLGELLDSQLSLREKIITRLHLFTCQACTRFAKQIEFMREVLEKQEKYFQIEDFSLNLDVQARERIKHALRSSAI